MSDLRTPNEPHEPDADGLFAELGAALRARPDPAVRAAHLAAARESFERLHQGSSGAARPILGRRWVAPKGVRAMWDAMIGRGAIATGAALVACVVLVLSPAGQALLRGPEGAREREAVAEQVETTAALAPASSAATPEQGVRGVEEELAPAEHRSPEGGGNGGVVAAVEVLPAEPIPEPIAPVWIVPLGERDDGERGGAGGWSGTGDLGTMDRSPTLAPEAFGAAPGTFPVSPSEGPAAPSAPGAAPGAAPMTAKPSDGAEAEFDDRGRARRLAAPLVPDEAGPEAGGAATPILRDQETAPDAMEVGVEAPAVVALRRVLEGGALPEPGSVAVGEIVAALALRGEMTSLGPGNVILSPMVVPAPWDADRLLVVVAVRGEEEVVLEWGPGVVQWRRLGEAGWKTRSANGRDRLVPGLASIWEVQVAAPGPVATLRAQGLTLTFGAGGDGARAVRLGDAGVEEFGGAAGTLEARGPDPQTDWRGRWAAAVTGWAALLDGADLRGWGVEEALALGEASGPAAQPEVLRLMQLSARLEQ